MLIYKPFLTPILAARGRQKSSLPVSISCYSNLNKLKSHNVTRKFYLNIVWMNCSFTNKSLCTCVYSYYQGYMDRFSEKLRGGLVLKLLSFFCSY